MNSSLAAEIGNASDALRDFVEMGQCDANHLAPLLAWLEQHGGSLAMLKSERLADALHSIGGGDDAAALKESARLQNILESLGVEPVKADNMEWARTVLNSWMRIRAETS